jgi:hypothetical protein
LLRLLDFLLLLITYAELNNHVDMTSSAPDRKPFPHTVEDFSSDSRITFYEDDNRHVLEDENGVEWEFSERLNKWTRMVG